MAIDLAQRLAAAAAVTDPSLMTRLRAAELAAPRPRRDLGGAPLIGSLASAFVYVAVAVAGGQGWGVAISTDTALALGVLTLAGGDRVFLLTLASTAIARPRLSTCAAR